MLEISRQPPPLPIRLDMSAQYRHTTARACLSSVLGVRGLVRWRRPRPPVSFLRLLVWFIILTGIRNPFLTVFSEMKFLLAVGAASRSPSMARLNLNWPYWLLQLSYGPVRGLFWSETSRETTLTTESKFPVSNIDCCHSLGCTPALNLLTNTFLVIGIWRARRSVSYALSTI